MSFTNPIPKVGFFYTPESYDALLDALRNQYPNDREYQAAVMATMFTSNLCAKSVDQAIEADEGLQHKAEHSAMIKSQHRLDGI